MTDSFTLEWTALTDKGRMRAKNEDMVRVESEYGFVALADGMGGYNAGEVASRIAVEGVSAALISWVHDASARLADPRGAPFTVAAALQALQACADEVNHAIFDDVNTQPDHAGMGTTLIVALVYQAQLLIGHIGDSRAYRWRSGALVQLTRDHSLLQEQVDEGRLTPAQAAAAWRYRGLLTRGLGVTDATQMDTLAVPLEKDDIYLLCSDGLTDMISDAEIATVLNSGLPLPDMTQVLIDQANTVGGRDNITVALLRVAG